MTENQGHGFTFEGFIKKILKVDHLAYNYTQKWDISNKIPISVKFMGVKNALEFGSTVRIWEINEPFILVIGRWKQLESKKVIVSVDEIKITKDILNKMRGSITLNEIKMFDQKIKKFSKGPIGQKEGILFARQWKKERKDRMGLLTITHKIDSKDQRRIQCNLNKKNYLSLFGEPSMKTTFKGQQIPIEIENGPRIRNKKTR